MPEHEIWLTQMFNDHLAGLGNAILGWFHVHASNPVRPWTNYITMQILVALVIVVIFAFLRARLSVTAPGKFQHAFEVMHEFIDHEAEDQVGHQKTQYLAFFGTIFIFVLFANLIGLVPGLESPTMSPVVPVGCAMATFAYYNMVGMQEHGIGKYLVHFAGPMPLLAPLMVPIEIISHLARPLSLSVRLFANMYAGEKVTMVFLGLTYFLVPAVFMGLHVFVSLLQAYIFMILTMLYVAGAVAHEH